MGIIDQLEQVSQPLNAGDVAKLLNVSTRVIYKMATKGTIPSFHVGSSVRFDAKTLIFWLKKKDPAFTLAQKS